MPITGGQDQLYDEVFGLIKEFVDAWDPAQAIGLRVIWQDQLENVDSNTPVLVVSIQHVLGRQASLAGGDGVRRWRSEGIVYMQVRCPAKGGLTTIGDLRNMCIMAIRGKSTPGGVWFRNVVGKEDAPKDGNSRATITGEFTYEEIS